MSEEPNREAAILNAALALSEPERSTYLDQACAGDPVFRQRIEELIQADEQAGNFLESPPAGLDLMRTKVVTVPLTEKPGDQIGRYKLLQQIGEGGCGVVYMAEQEEPVRRRVALKVIKLGMDTKQVIARFEAERQALALMDHPNITKVLDAGATETGRPYFVMELVRGIKITEFCDQNKLSTEERLKLFIQVCQAVQHAHQKGVIHRDLKPSNILVTVSDPGAPGVPKVIDFGIAKATQGRLTDQTLFTAFEQFLGTPAYMSPEQAMLTALDIDTRSDIYSLGVLLYELLTGKTPFDQKELLAAGLDEMRRTIREKEPQKPSTRLSTMLDGERSATAMHRQTDPPKLMHLVRGDLDWIVMKSLEKDRARRYETANGLAADIQRHLDNEPVNARPPGRFYRFQKSVRRNQGIYAAAAAIAAVLIIGVTVSTWEAIRATKAEREQTQMREQAERARDAANEQENLAQRSGAEAGRQARLASEQASLARRRFYASQMNLAGEAAQSGDLVRTLDLLETLRPGSGQEDLRSFEWYHLWGKCNRWHRMTLRGHQGAVTSIALSRDGGTLASTGSDGTLRLWNIDIGQEIQRLPIPASSVVFAKDGRTLIIGGADGAVRLWDLDARKTVDTLSGHRGQIWSLAVSPDGKTVASGEEMGTTTLWDLGTHVARTNWTVGRLPVVGLAYAPDGTKLAAVSGWNGDDALKIWDLTSDSREPKLRLAGGRNVAFSPDGQTVATAPYDSILCYNADTGKLQSRLHGPPVTAVVYLPDGKQLVSITGDRTIRLRTIPSGAGGTVEGQIIGEHLDVPGCLAMSADGATLATGANDGSIQLWNVVPAHEADSTDHFQFDSGSLYSIGLAPDANTVFGIMAHGMETRNLLTGYQSPALTPAAGYGALSPDGKLLATGANNGILKLWDTASGQLLATRKAHVGEILSLAFSPDGQLLATASYTDPAVKVWKPDSSLRLLWTKNTAGVGVDCVCFSPNGKTLAAASRYDSILLLNATTGQPAQLLRISTGNTEVYALAFSPDGRTLAAGGEQAVIKLLDIENGRLQGTLKGHSGSIHAIAFSGDGNTIATGGDDCIVRLWDPVTGQERCMLSGFKSPVRAAAFSAPGDLLVAASMDGSLSLWRARRSPDALALDESSAVANSLNASDSIGLAWLLVVQPGERRDAEKALKLIQGPLASAPKDAFLLSALGAAYYRAGQFEKAHETLSKIGSGRFLAYSLFFLAMNSRSQGDLQKAYEYYDRGLAETENGPEIPELLRLRAETEKIIDVAARYREAVRISPQSAQANYDLARVLLRSSEPAESPLPYLREATRLDPTNLPARFDFGCALANEADWPGAARVLAQVIRSEPAYSDARARFAECERQIITQILKLSGKSPQGVAESIIRVKAETDDAALAEPFQILVFAEYLVLDDQPEKSAALIRQALTAGGHGISFSKSLGWALLRCGRPAEAREALGAGLPQPGWGGNIPPDADPDRVIATYLHGDITSDVCVEFFKGKQTPAHKHLDCMPWFYVGQQKEAVGQREAALAAYQKCVEIGIGPDAHLTANWAAYRLHVLTHKPLVVGDLEKTDF